MLSSFCNSLYFSDISNQNYAIFKHFTISSLNAVYISGKENYSSVSDDRNFCLINKKEFFLKLTD